MNKGAFIVSREIFNNPIWQDVQSFRIFFYILGQAVFSDEGVRKGNVHIKKGQYLRSFRNLQSDLEYIENRRIKQYSISTISRKVNSLVSQGRLKIEDTELGTLFTVVNYESYQLLSNYKGTELGTALEQSGNGVGTEQEQNRNNNKNVKNVKNDKKSTSRSKLKFETTHMDLAEHFYNQILKNNPGHKKPNLKMWANEIRLMIERDNRTEEQIKYLMEWVQNDDFEMTNVLSPSKLRKRFDQLVMKVKNEKGKASPKKQDDYAVYQSDNVELTEDDLY